MPQNIEIKGKVRNIEQLRATARELTEEPVVVLIQEDVFFPCPHGRLKLRQFAHGGGELIHYERGDELETKQSDYLICELEDPQAMRQLLTRAYGELVVVRKRRELYLVGQTRIHVDQVEGLGDFMELEFVLQPGQDPKEGADGVNSLMARLGIEQNDLVACAYADLILGKNKS